MPRFALLRIFVAGLAFLLVGGSASASTASFEVDFSDTQEGLFISYPNTVNWTNAFFVSVTVGNVDLIPNEWPTYVITGEGPEDFYGKAWEPADMEHNTMLGVPVEYFKHSAVKVVTERGLLGVVWVEDGEMEGMELTGASGNGFYTQGLTLRQATNPSTVMYRLREEAVAWKEFIMLGTLVGFASFSLISLAFFRGGGGRDASE